MQFRLVDGHFTALSLAQLVIAVNLRPFWDIGDQQVAPNKFSVKTHQPYGTNDTPRIARRYRKEIVMPMLMHCLQCN